MKRITAALAVCALATLGTTVAQASASSTDYAQMARNIIPSGEPGGFPVPAGADTQAKMYNALTPLADHVTNARPVQRLQVRGCSVSVPMARDCRAGSLPRA